MKMRIALSLMLAMLAIGNTATAGPFAVSMGDTFRPDKGWNQGGFGAASREYKGTFPFRSVFVEGTREGGACAVRADMWGTDEFKNLRDRLARKYGEPSSERQHEARWSLSGNPDKIRSIVLWIDEGWIDVVYLQYRFENHQQCEIAKESEL